MQKFRINSPRYSTLFYVVGPADPTLLCGTSEPPNAVVGSQAPPEAGGHVIRGPAPAATCSCTSRHTVMAYKHPLCSVTSWPAGTVYGSCAYQYTSSARAQLICANLRPRPFESQLQERCKVSRHMCC